MALLDIVGVTVTAVTTPSTLFFLLLATVPLFGIYVAVYTLSRRVPWPANAPPIALDNYPITGSWGFWGRRWSWHRRQRDATPSGNFAFHAGPNTIVGLSGDAGRRLFFESKDLGFSEGYAVLFGQSPTVEALDVGEGKDHDINNHFIRRIVFLLKNEQFRRKLPTLIADTQEAMDAIGNDPSGVTNPFESLYHIVFRLTIRMVGADDIADDAQLLEQTLALFETIEASATATSVMFPKVPSPALLKRTYAGTKLYFLIEGIIKKRTASGEKHDDALQYMLDQGDRTFRIIEFVVGALFAGLLNSGINAAWVACYLACSPEWLAKAQDEVRAAAAKYARDPSAPLRYQLDDVPLEAWESEFPVIDMCLRDSIRLNLLGTAFRKNTSGRPIPTGHGNEVIPPGAFVTYATGDIHLDPQVYPDPLKWDPARYLPDRAEDKKKPDAFVGWGTGRHPCLGVRFAKLEQNIITAYFIASFDFSLEDEKGNKVTTPPQVDVERHSAHKPNPPQFLRVTPKYK
ncbi:cytochrome P450 6A1 [Colletotrichum higginsianum]|uniref:Cytochrome P450 6A1 n=1 Tax=Colletotrichum higginsianum (strain IMI 349063) TaxID=759273 RepID=H1UX68_COLHI|nr:Cytochrome P450 6A1 [Colletotrichum higginsianum IMI 349063]OBR11348.1 Cytochrome P450 6A1 [Colletotrichum higginsianum IMI 349063]CCF32569.1 cytochrome P450 6A1 [Colletotrichum higginsianum]